MSLDVQQICTMAANGNKEASRFALAWVAACHHVDDSADRDVKVPADEDLALWFAEYTLTIAGNPFFLAHKPGLVALMIQSINAWLDSNRKSGPERYVLAGMYHEVVFHVAFLTGGWKHLRRVTQECREYKTLEGAV